MPLDWNRCNLGGRRHEMLTMSAEEPETLKAMTSACVRLSSSSDASFQRTTSPHSPQSSRRLRSSVRELPRTIPWKWNDVGPPPAAGARRRRFSDAPIRTTATTTRTTTTTGRPRPGRGRVVRRRTSDRRRTRLQVDRTPSPRSRRTTPDDRRTADRQPMTPSKFRRLRDISTSVSYVRRLLGHLTASRRPRSE